mgnify:FL=1
MKLALFIIMCSALYNKCLPPIDTGQLYDTHYDCMVAGYNKTLKTTEEIGSEDVNLHKTYIKFYCREIPNMEKNT